MGVAGDGDIEDALWLIKTGDSEVGPVSTDEMVAMIEAGEVSARTLVRTLGGPDRWQRTDTTSLMRLARSRPQTANRLAGFLAGVVFASALVFSPIATAQSAFSPPPIMYDLGEGSLKVALASVDLPPGQPQRFLVTAFAYPSTAENHARIAGVLVAAYRSICGALDIRVRLYRTDLPDSYERVFGDGDRTWSMLAELSWRGNAVATESMRGTTIKWPSLREIDADAFYRARSLHYLELGMPDERADRRALTETRQRFRSGPINATAITSGLSRDALARATMPLARLDDLLRAAVARSCRGFWWQR